MLHVKLYDFTTCHSEFVDTFVVNLPCVIGGEGHGTELARQVLGRNVLGVDVAVYVLQFVGSVRAAGPAAMIALARGQHKYVVFHPI